MYENFQYIIINHNAEIISSSKNYETIFDLELIPEASSVVSIKNKSYRVCKIISTKGIIYAYSDSKTFIKSSKQFRIHLSVLESFLEELIEFKKNVLEIATKQIKILVHNLVSLNAQNLQEIYNVIPQEKLTTSIPDKLKYISNTIKSNPDKSALVLLKLMKNNIAMKTEFAVFNKLHQSNPNLSLQNHNVHRVLMNIFYSFFSDFTDKKIYINIERCSYTAYFDYESIYVAFFHIIENTAKYIKQNSKLNIFIKDYNNEVKIIFDMVSLKIDNSEINKIFEEGYSGKFAKKYEKEGSGIGLSRVKKIIELNSGEVLIETSIGDSLDDYTNNKFIIKLKKEKHFL